MSSLAFAAAYASVDPIEGKDVRVTATALLQKHRVLAALRDASAPLEEGEEAVYLIPVTDSAEVLTLDDRDAVVATLSTAALRAAFAAEGMTLWLDGGEDDEDVADDVEDVSDDGEDDESGEDEWDDTEDELVDWGEESTVRVAEFSHRARGLARGVAEYLHTPVSYSEEGDWSLFRYETAESHTAFPPSRSESPIIVLNIPSSGEPWIEITVSAGSFAMPVWPDAEQDTRPVLELDAISLPQSVEIYRRFLSEADGVRDELAAIAESVPLDVEAAHLAVMPEAVGGLTEGRLEAFLAAFGVPAALIERSLATKVTGEETLIEPSGWGSAALDVLVAGSSELRPLTRRDSLFARLEAGLRRRPVLAASLSAAEAVAGVVATRKLRGGWKVFGVLVVLDGLADLAITLLRRSRSTR